MFKQVIAIVLAGLASSAVAQSFVKITEEFSSDPSARWKVHGENSAFSWDATAGKVRVTWDSSKPKSLFYIGLPETLTRSNSFWFEFDLVLDDIVSGHEEGKTGPMQIGVGLLNRDATNAAWSRTDWGSASNVFEFNCYPSGEYPGFILEPTTTPGIVSASGFSYSPSDLSAYKRQLPLGELVHISMRFDARTQVLKAVWTTNGVPVGFVHELNISDPAQSQFGVSDNYAVTMFSISSYKGNDWDSVLAHGSVDNIEIGMASTTLNINGKMAGDSWVTELNAVDGWTYRLERSTDLLSWDFVGEEAATQTGVLAITDSNMPIGKAYYRVRASQ